MGSHVRPTLLPPNVITLEHGEMVVEGEAKVVEETKALLDKPVFYTPEEQAALFIGDEGAFDE